MTEIKLVTELLSRCRNVDIYGELLTLVELSKRHNDIEWLGGHRNPYDIKCDGKGIEVKSCNTENKWALARRKKEPTFESGFGHINPVKFAYLVCVSFSERNGCFTNEKFYVFTPEEARTFEKSIGKSRDTYTIEILQHKDERRNIAIRNASGSGAWDRIK